jgi:hypothetical protein
LLPQWILILPLSGGATKHKEMQIWFKQFLVGGLKNLQEDFFCEFKFGNKFKLNAFSPT